MDYQACGRLEIINKGRTSSKYSAIMIVLSRLNKIPNEMHKCQIVRRV